MALLFLWLVDSVDTSEVYVLEHGTYMLMGQYHMGEVARSQGLPGFAVSVETILPR